MGEAIGQTLTFAVAAAPSPIPIIAVILMLVTPRARMNGPAFVAGWLLGLAAVGTVVLLVAADRPDTDDGGDPATWVSVLKLLLCLALALVALRQWRGRPREGDQAPTPAWMGAIESFTPPKAAGAGAVLAGVNPKNLLLSVGAAATIAQTGISPGSQAIAYGVFALVATIGVAAPVGIYFAMGSRAEPILDNLRRWLAAHNAVIMAVICLVIGAKLVGDAIAGLA